MCNGTFTVDLIEPGTQFEDRLNAVDFKLARIFRWGRARLEGSVDVFNAFNAANVRGEVLGFGATWRQPTNAILGRLVKFGATLNF